MDETLTIDELTYLVAKGDITKKKFVLDLTLSEIGKLFLLMEKESFENWWTQEIIKKNN